MIPQSDLYEDRITTVDRSTLQSYATCPMQARLLAERKGVVGDAAVVGEEIHQVFGATVQSYIDADGNLSKSDVADLLEANLRASRPDMQPLVLDACRASLWGLAEYLAVLNPVNILHFDGGLGERSGQLASDIKGVGLRVTSELDFVSTPDPEFLKVLDLKSGRAHWSDDDVRTSFQFGLHAWLLFRKYEHVNTVHIAVWMTRFGKRTPFVEFTRRRMADLYDRILEAADAWARYERCVIEQVPTWPSLEKCRICDCAAQCPAAERELQLDPAALLDQLVATETKSRAIEKILAAAVDNGGCDIVSPSGACFGTGKPASRKPTKSLYSRKAILDEDGK